MTTLTSGNADIKVHGPNVDVKVKEELDTAAAARLSGVLDAVLRLRPERLVVDLSGCPYVGAAAIHVLLEMHRRAWRQSCELVLRSPSNRVMRQLTLARLDGVIRLVRANACGNIPGHTGGDS